MSYTPPTTAAFKRVVQAAFAVTLTPNSTNTDIFRVTLTGSATLAVPSGSPFDGQQMLLEITQDATGNRTLTFGAGYQIGDDVGTPVLSTSGGKTDVIAIQYSQASGKWKILAAPSGY